MRGLALTLIVLPALLVPSIPTSLLLTVRVLLVTSVISTPIIVIAVILLVLLLGAQPAHVIQTHLRMGRRSEEEK